MSASTPDPTGRPLAEGPHDPEHDPTASYALEPEYVEALTRRILATSGETAEVRSPINGAPLAHIPQSTEDDVVEAFARARRAQDLVRLRTVLDRVLLPTLADLVGYSRALQSRAFRRAHIRAQDAYAWMKDEGRRKPK